MISRGFLKDVEPKKISWLWRPFIAFGKVTLIQGDTGIGKTSLMVKFMADLSCGIRPPTMFHSQLRPQETGEPITTYYVSVENGIADTIIPLFDLVNGNKEYVQYCKFVIEHGNREFTDIEKKILEATVDQSRNLNQLFAVAIASLGMGK